MKNRRFRRLHRLELLTDEMKILFNTENTENRRGHRVTSISLIPLCASVPLWLPIIIPRRIRCF